MCRWAVSRRRIMSWVGNWRSWQTAWTNRRASIIARCDHRDEEEINQINKQRAIDSQIFTQLNVKDGEIRQLLEKITSQREAYRDLMQVSHHIVIILSLHFTINQHHITIRGLWDLLQQGLCQMLWKSCSKNSHPGQTKVHPGHKSSCAQAKTALDMEIAVYRKLVECEEDRLGITASETFYMFFFNNVYHSMAHVIHSI